MKKIVAVLIIISLTLTGCWDSIEAENLGVIRLMGVGLDKYNNIRVLVQEVPHEKQTSGGGAPSGTSSRAFHLYAESGTTIYDALQKMPGIEHHTFFLPQLEVVVLDEDLVRSKGLAPIIDFFERDPRLLPAAWMLVAPRGQLDKILSTDIGLNVDTGRILDETIHNVKTNPYRTVNKLSDIIDSLYKSGSEVYTSGIILNSKDSPIEPGSGQKSPTKKFRLINTAVFKDGKMVGWLADEEHKGVSWAGGHVKGGTVTIPFDDGSISLRVDKVRSGTKATLNDGKMGIEINVKITANLIECPVNYNYLDEGTINKVQQSFDETVKREISAAITKSKALESDFFGFGNRFNMSYPYLWKDVKNNWYSYYKDVKVKINVSSTVKGIGNNFKPIR